MRNVSLLLFLALCAGACGKFGKSTSELTDSAAAFHTKGEFTSAIVQLKNALAQQPDNVEANALIGLSYAQAGELVDAERKLRRALELGARPERLVPVLGRVLIESEQYQKALDELRKTQELDGDTMSRIAILAAEAHLGLDQISEARAQYLLAEKNHPTEVKLGLARVAAAQGDREAAYRLTDALLGGAQPSAEAWLVKGDLLRGDAKIQEALAAYQKASTLAPANVIARLSLAATYTELGQHDAAGAELTQVRKRAPANVMLQFMLAQTALRERKFDQCADHLQAVFRLIPQHMPSVLLSGSLLYATDRLEQAQIAFATYLKRNPNHIYARKMLVATLLRKGQPQSAIHLLEPLLPYVKDDAEVLGIAGEAYMQAGQVRKAREYLAKAVALAPQNAEVRTKLGMTQLATGNVRQGVSDLESAVALNPDDSRADHLLIMTLVVQNETEKARQAMQALEKRRPDKPDTYFLKGALYRAQQQWADARTSFEQALKLQATYFPAAASLAQLDLQEKNPDAARARMTGLLKLDARNLDAMLVLAQMELDAGRNADAVAWLRKAAAEHPQSMQTFLLLAQAHLQGGRTGEAVTTAQQARSINPKDVRALEALGNAQMAAGDKDGAIGTFILLTDMLPTALPAQLKLVAAYHANGNFRDANTIIRRVLERAPQNLDAKAALVENLLRTKGYREAMAVLQKMQKQDPQRAQSYTLEGEIWFAQRNYANAAAAYDKADALQPNGLLRVRLHQARSNLGSGADAELKLQEWINKHPEDAATRYYLAEVDNKAGRYRAAAAHYQAVLKNDPNDYRTLNNLAWVLLSDGDPKALDYAQQAFNLKPNDAVVADTLGWVYVKQGKVREGTDILAKAVKLNADNPQIRYHLIQALVESGDTSRARSELKILLASKKTFTQMEEARALLKRLDT